MTNSDDILTDCLEAFLERWEADGFGPPLRDYLPVGAAELRREVLIEIVKVDLEYRYASGGPILSLEDYLAECPELGEPDGLPVELIHEDFHARKAAGLEPSVKDYLDRFPEKAEAIAKHFHLESTTIGDVTGEQLASAFEPGQHIDDFYLMNRLGAGAFGSVFLARQESMQRTVALKISGDKGSEGQTLAQLDHPNIVRVYDQVRLTDQNLRLLYMQFAAGGTLQAVVKTSRAFPDRGGNVLRSCVAEAVQRTGLLSAQAVTMKEGLADKSWAQVVSFIGMELAHGLEYAHQQGILHRDVKPANVLLDANGTAKLADFNISFNAEADGASAAENFGGSLAYMSPEQLNACNPVHAATAQDVDERSDIYSLALVLWELFYGRRPFADESITGGWTETCTQLAALRQAGVPMNETPADPVERRLVVILQRALRAEASQRPQTAGEFAQDLGLTVQPQVAKLLNNAEVGWRRRASSGWVAGALIVLAAMLPNIVAGVFNYEYNVAAIIEPLPEVKQEFDLLQKWVNGIAYPIGLAVTLAVVLPLIRVLRGKTGGQLGSESGDVATQSRVKAQREQRVRSLGMGRFVAVLGVSLWTIAGLVYPGVLHWHREGGLELHWHVHFFSSLLVCGLIAAAYPFFIASTIAVKSVFPRLLAGDGLQATDVSALKTLSKRTTSFLYLAGGVPAVGMLFLLVMEQTDEHSTAALKVLSACGAFGFALILKLATSLQQDIEGLIDAAGMQRE